MGVVDAIVGLAFPDPNVTGLLKWVDVSGATQSLTAAVTATSDERTAQVTQHPTEKGSPITDHIIYNLPTLTLEIVESNTPITLPREGFELKTLDLSAFVPKSRFVPRGLLAITRAVTGAAGVVIEAGANLLGVSSPGAPNGLTIQSTSSEFQNLENNLHNLLLQLFENPPDTGVSISVAGREYQSYVINRVNKEKRALGPTVFAVDVTKLNTVSTLLVDLPNPSDLLAQRSKSRGNKPPKPLTDEEADALVGGDSSLLATGADAIASKFF